MGAVLAIAAALLLALAEPAAADTTVTASMAQANTHATIYFTRAANGTWANVHAYNWYIADTAADGHSPYGQVWIHDQFGDHKLAEHWNHNGAGTNVLQANVSWANNAAIQRAWVRICNEGFTTDSCYSSVSVYP